MDEILIKYENNWTMPKTLAPHINKIPLSDEVLSLINVSLPILNRHIDQLLQEAKDHISKSYFEEQLKNSLNELSNEARAIHLGKVDLDQYIGANYGDEIEKFLLKSRVYVSTSEVIFHLRQHHGMDYKVGLELEKFIETYLKNHENYRHKLDSYSFSMFKHVKYFKK